MHLGSVQRTEGLTGVSFDAATVQERGQVSPCSRCHKTEAKSQAQGERQSQKTNINKPNAQEAEQKVRKGKEKSETTLKDRGCRRRREKLRQNSKKSFSLHTRRVNGRK